MEFKDIFIPTGIGSLPHKDEKKACRLILQNFPEIPFWPQLPMRSFREGMVVQYSEGFPCFRVNEKEQKAWVDTTQGFDQEVERFYQSLEEKGLEAFRISEDFAKGLRLIEELRLGNHQKEIKYVKGQIVGPITFGLSLTDQERKSIFYNPTLRDVLIKHLSFKAQWMETWFNDLLPGIRTILFFDEPALSAYGSAFSSLSREDVIDSLNECFNAIKGLKGIHCCGNTDWSLLLETDLDILSFDAYGYLETISLYPKELNAFLQRGGILAWGIVPTSEEAILKEDGQSLTRRFKEGVKTLSKEGIDPKLLQRAIITPSCGTASLSVPLAEKVCRVTAEVSKRLRESSISPAF
ncbi:MAG: methionine synthase [Thermodesulfobacteriota bacterium]